MAEEMGADEVARKQFSTAFRGFDQYEVRAFLAQVASTIATLREREKAFREKVAGLEAASPAPHRADEADLEQALGAEMTKVLHAAREAASEIRVHAEESVARLLREATDEAASLRADAESILAKRSEEAEVAAAAIIAAAEERGREMVGEAQSVRERMLKDLSRKRKVAAVQLEQLLAARQRLLDAYDVVRQNLDSVTDELNGAEEQAKLAADMAGFKRRAEEPADDVELSSQVSDAEPSHEPESTPDPQSSSPTLIVIEDADAAAGDPPGSSGVPGDDRRSSSLRLLRRKPEPAESSGDGGSEGEVHEGVRLLRPEATPAPRPVSLVRDEPEPDGDEMGEPDLHAVDDDLDEPDLPEDVVLDGEGFGDDAPAAPVEDLFARLRADRAAALEHAQTVLTEPEPDAAVEPKPEPAPEVAVDEPGADVVEPPESPEAAGDAVFEARDAALEPLERALTRALKRALADEQNEVLDTLRRAKRTPSLDELMPSAERHVERFAAMSREHLRAGVEVGAASHDGAAPEVDELAHQFGADITDDVRARVGRALDSTGNDDEALVEAISATYREWKTSRSEPFARHHLAAAYALGAFSALEDGSLRWIVDVAEGGCPDCDDNALAGPTPKGERYPTGQAHPPAHMGCRCLVVPLAK